MSKAKENKNSLFLRKYFWRRSCPKFSFILFFEWVPNYERDFFATLFLYLSIIPSKFYNINLTLVGAFPMIYDHGAELKLKLRK